MATVVIAEKPSVARDIARVLGASGKGQGCLLGKGYIVTWALGHLVQFAEPDEYGPPWNTRWAFSQLPMVPEKWKLRTSKATSAQFQIIKKLINDRETDSLICATDAGHEGDLSFVCMNTRAVRSPSEASGFQLAGRGDSRELPTNRRQSMDDLGGGAHAPERGLSV